MIIEQKDGITTCPHSCDKQMKNVCQNINSQIYGGKMEYKYKQMRAERALVISHPAERPAAISPRSQ